MRQITMKGASLRTCTLPENTPTSQRIIVMLQTGYLMDWDVGDKLFWVWWPDGIGYLHTTCQCLPRFVRCLPPSTPLKNKALRLKSA